MMPWGLRLPVHQFDHHPCVSLRWAHRRASCTRCRRTPCSARGAAARYRTRSLWSRRKWQKSPEEIIQIKFSRLLVHCITWRWSLFTFLVNLPMWIFVDWGGKTSDQIKGPVNLRSLWKPAKLLAKGHLRCRTPLPSPTSAPPPIPGFGARAAASVARPRSTLRAENDDRSKMLPDGNIKKPRWALFWRWRSLLRGWRGRSFLAWRGRLALWWLE